MADVDIARMSANSPPRHLLSTVSSAPMDAVTLPAPPQQNQAPLNERSPVFAHRAARVMRTPQSPIRRDTPMRRTPNFNPTQDAKNLNLEVRRLSHGRRA